ncbi:hypothetical protein Bpfe_002836, partial [Biomphalaria pfeifferi]
IILCDLAPDDYRFCNKILPSVSELSDDYCGCSGKYTNSTSGAKSFRIFYHIKAVNRSLR